MPSLVLNLAENRRAVGERRVRCRNVTRSKIPMPKEELCHSLLVLSQGERHGPGAAEPS